MSVLDPLNPFASYLCHLSLVDEEFAHFSSLAVAVSGIIVSSIWQGFPLSPSSVIIDCNLSPEEVHMCASRFGSLLTDRRSELRDSNPKIFELIEINFNNLNKIFNFQFSKIFILDSIDTLLPHTNRRTALRDSTPRTVRKSLVDQTTEWRRSNSRKRSLLRTPMQRNKRVSVIPPATPKEQIQAVPFGEREPLKEMNQKFSKESKFRDFELI